MNEEEVEILKNQSNDFFKKGEYLNAYEINKKLSDEFPQSYDFKAKCMNNLLSLKRFDEAKKIYLSILHDMRNRGCGWKLFESKEKMKYKLPMEIKFGFLASCVFNGYYKEAKEEALKIIEFYCKAGFNIENSKYCKDHGYTMMNGYFSIYEFENLFIKMRENGVDIPDFQTAINEYHQKEEEKNEVARIIKEKIIESDDNVHLRELINNHIKVFVVDRGNYMYHSLCLDREEPFDVSKLHGATGEKTGGRAICCYMTIKEANSVNPFAVCREIEISNLLNLMAAKSNFEVILLKYNSDSELIIPVDIFKI